MTHIAVLFEDQEILELSPVSVSESNPVSEIKADFYCRISKAEYLETVNKLLEHIKRGDIYEINYCIEFFAENVEINPEKVFIHLKTLTEAPFAQLYKTKDDRWILCASPERFIKKIGTKLITQPMKGTASRGKNAEEDQQLKTALANSLKEQTENVMATDVARNDLSILAKKGTVVTEELFGVQTFKNVHQMVSTVTCELKKDVTFENILGAVFPAASMTGAPKMKAVELINKYELSERGIYSGCIGSIQENGDFDFCVVIRSIIYYEKKKRISFHVGSAITANCNPEEEWNECLLKANAMLQALGTSKEKIKFPA
jgi:para-aminobenzoate synthetase component I